MLLEERIVPADYYWRPTVPVGGPYLASNIQNWRDAQGRAYQQLPGVHDKLFFDANGNRQCVLDSANNLSNEFAALSSDGFTLGIAIPDGNRWFTGDGVQHLASTGSIQFLTDMPRGNSVVFNGSPANFGWLGVTKLSIVNGTVLNPINTLTIASATFVRGGLTNYGTLN